MSTSRAVKDGAVALSFNIIKSKEEKNLHTYMYSCSFKRCRLQQGMTTMTTTHNSGHNMLPLRETCNRCRELKVRCRANFSATNTIGAPGPGARGAHGPSPDRTFSVCLRCSRAGAVCTYGPKQRSGRPRTSHLKPQARDSSLSTCQAFAHHGAVHKPPGGSESPSPAVSPQSCHEATRTSGFRASISLDPPVCQPLDWAHVLSLPDLMPESMANNTDTDEMAALLDGQSRSGSATDAMTTTDHSPPAVWDTNPSYGIAGPTLSGEHQMHCDSDDDMVKDMGELMSLNVRIYLLQAQLGTTPPMLALCDEMASITRSFLTILERMVDSQSPSTQAQRTSSFPSDTVHVPPGHQAEDSLDLNLRRQLVEVAIYAKDSFESVCDTIDASTFLIILACYQRLVDLFKHVCLSVHTHLQDHDTGGSDEPSLTTAQVVMTTELISHLLGRLDRGLQKLTPSSPLGTLSPSTTTAASVAPSRRSIVAAAPRHMSTFSTSDSSELGTWTRTEPDQGAQHTLRFSTPTWNCFLGAGKAVDAMTRRQAALREHIGIIKHSIQESDMV